MSLLSNFAHEIFKLYIHSVGQRKTTRDREGKRKEKACSERKLATNYYQGHQGLSLNEISSNIAVYSSIFPGLFNLKKWTLYLMHFTLTNRMIR